MASTTAATTHDVTLTESAARIVADLLSADGRTDLQLRLGVRPGGCGMAYDLNLDDQTRPDDLVRDCHGVSVVVDRVSAAFLTGAVIDFVSTPGRQGFTINNPSARGGGSGCCG